MSNEERRPPNLDALRAKSRSADPPPVQPSPAATLAESPEAEMARLRAENIALRQQVAAGPSRLPSTPGTLQPYRVRHPAILHNDGHITWSRVRVTKYIIGPRKPMAGTTPIPEKYRAMPSETYDALALMDDDTTGRFDGPAAAWKRYTAKHGVDPETERDFFKVVADAGPVQDYLDIPAARSPADAFETFRRYCGIRNTVHTPEVTVLPVPPALAG